MADEHEKKDFTRACLWFFGTPERAETFVRRFGTIDNFEEKWVQMLAILESQSRRTWAVTQTLRIFKVVVAVGLGIAGINGGYVVLRALLGWP